jgi:hypothetical protein
MLTRILRTVKMPDQGDTGDIKLAVIATPGSKTGINTHS